MTKERYDKEEDRANDIKKHDNPNHPSKISHDKKLDEAKEKQKEDLKLKTIMVA